MGQSTEVFVGIDVAKERNVIAVADGERGGEVRFLGEVDASPESMRRGSSSRRSITATAMHLATITR